MAKRNRKGKRGRAARNARQGDANIEPEEIVKAPHSFVIKRGKVGKNVNELMINFRKLMEPYTASHLKVGKHNVLKDFVHVAGPLNVTHLIAFTKSEIAVYMRVIRLPRGPTLTFKVHEYSLTRDVISSLKKAIVYDQLFSFHPLLVLNNFSGEGLHFKLMTTMFQGMFPSINVNKANLNSIRRCLLMNYNEDKTIDFRHFAIRIVPSGISKAVKKLIQSKVPDLGAYEDVSEFMMKSGNLSDSEVEMDGAINQVILPQPISSRGNITSQKSAIRLYELGPRMKLQLIKIEEGIVAGETLFHEYIAKTPQEIAAIKAMRKQKIALKEKRKMVQQQNVERKQREKDKVNENAQDDNQAKDGDNDSSDEEWYQKEIGKPQDKDLTSSRKRKQSSFMNDKRPVKKSKMSSGKRSDETEEKKQKTLQEVLAARKKKKFAKQKKKRSQRKSKKVTSSKGKHKSKR